MAENTHLLVPVALEALVVNRNDLATTIWSLSEKQYNQRSRFGPLDPPPFTRDNGRPPTGVTLHWALPDGLTRGRDVGGRMVFHSVPNRWLVVRLLDTPAGQSRAWVVESDALDARRGANLYLDENGDITRLGRSFLLQDWVAPANADAAPKFQSARRLTALGLQRDNTLLGSPDPAFAAYVPNVRDVFSFCDDLSDLPEETALTLHYMVVGWYAPGSAADDTPPEDPLADQSRLGLRFVAPKGQTRRAGVPDTQWDSKPEWDKVLQTLQWTAGTDEQLLLAIPDLANSAGRAPLPSRTLCHGMVYGVNWTGMNGAPQPVMHVPGSPFDSLAIERPPVSGAPDPDPIRANLPHIAVANSITDAFATLMEYTLEGEDKGTDFGKLFQALQTDLGASFDQPGSDVELDNRVRQNWFLAGEAGSYWDIAIEKAAGVTDKEVQLPQLTAVQNTRLTTVNAAQVAFDEATRDLRSKQRELYFRWWKSTQLPNLRTLPVSLADLNLPAAAQAVHGSLQDVAAKQAALAAAKSDLQAVVVNAPAAKYTFRVVENRMPRYYRPADPIVLVYGSRASSKHGGDGRFNKDGKLECRLSGSVVRNFQIGARSVTAAQVVNEWFSTVRNAVTTADASRRLPAPVPALLAELALLNPQWASHLARIPTFAGVDVAEVAARQRMPWAAPPDGATSADVTAAAGFDGVWPSRVGVESWSQPWAPLFLAWRLTWYPTSADASHVHDDWIFNGADYDWTGLGKLDNSLAVYMQGRSILAAPSTDAFANAVFDLFTPPVTEKERERDLLNGQIADTIDAVRAIQGTRAESELTAEESTRIRALAATHAALADQSAAVLAQLAVREARRARLSDDMRSVDVLAQALTGFHDKLIMRDPSQYYEPPAAETAGGFNLQALLQDGPRAAPIPYSYASPDGLFNPIRAGHVRLDRVWVIDGFGQVFDPIQARGESVSSFTPLRGSGLETRGLTQRTDTQALQCPPRLCQPSRLMFRLIDAAGSSGADTALDAAANPVCGWLLPNQLDDSMVVFDPGGNALGSVTLTGAGAAKGLLWLPAVGSSASLSDRRDVESRVNPHLGQLINGLFALTDAADAFVDWMAAIDSTLWTTEPLGKRGDNLSVLIGRPIAVVRVQLNIELAEPPAANQLWSKTKANDTSGFAGVGFDVRLGNVNLRGDGTLGYYGPGSSGTDYSAFFTVFSKLDLRQPGAAQRFVRVGNLTAGITRPVHATVLLDPRGAVNARTGILPAKAIQLPSKYTEPALANMDVTFRVGPILTEPTTLRMPLPVNISGSWAWIEHTGVALATDAKIQNATPEAQLSDQPTHIREGYLQLSDAVTSNT